MRVSFRSVGVRSMVVMAVAFACHACGNAAPPPAASAAPPATTTAPATATVTPASTAEATGFGVAECDDYMKKYLACIDKLAPAAQGQARQMLEQSRDAWKQAAATAEGKAALATTCKSASDAAGQALRAQGCTW